MQRKMMFSIYLDQSLYQKYICYSYDLLYFISNILKLLGFAPSQAMQTDCKGRINWAHKK